MKGRYPKPYAQKKAEGFRGHKPLVKEPRHVEGTPKKPRAMSAPAKEIWEEFIETMDPRMLCQTDRRALWELAEDEALLAEAYQGFWKMAAALKAKAKKEGKELPAGEIVALLTMSNGKVAMNAIRDLAARVMNERREFGMTPSSRCRINMAGKEAGDGLDDAIFSQHAQLLVLPKSG